MNRKPLVVLGILGSRLDAGSGPRRWERWRPTVSLAQQEDLLVDRLELLCERRDQRLARTVQEDIATVSPETELRLHPIDLSNPWDLEEVYGALHDLARSYPFRPERERYLVHITTGTHVVQICLFLLTESRHFPAQLIQTRPAGKDGAGYSIIDLDLSRYDRIAERFRVEQREGLSFLKSGIDTRNAGFNALIERIEAVALATRAPILLTGPTGAGKSRLARRIYELRRQRRALEGAFVEVNCATLRGDAAMSTLFGHVRGAFTGAVEPRAGLLATAHRGVLFLDEIGDLGLDEQAMLLRAIEEGVYYPVGSDRVHESDFELIAGTHRDLRARVADGLFREDLLARIDLWTFRLPALAERPEDIEPNLTYELARFAEAEGRVVRFNREGRRRFLAFATGPEGRWPGNFRDLNAAVTRMATLAPGGRIGTPQVDEERARLVEMWSGGSDAAGRAARGGRVEELLGGTRAAELDRFDRVQLEDVLEVCASASSLSAAGRVLFARSRERRTSVNDADRLRKYLARFDLDWTSVRAR